MGEVIIRETDEQIREEIRRFGPEAAKFLLRQLELIQKRSEKAESDHALSELSIAAAELIKCFQEDWFYWAFPDQSDRVRTNTGLHIRRASFQG